MTFIQPLLVSHVKSGVEKPQKTIIIINVKQRNSKRSKQTRESTTLQINCAKTWRSNCAKNWTHFKVLFQSVMFQRSYEIVCFQIYLISFSLLKCRLLNLVYNKSRILSWIAAIKCRDDIKIFDLISLVLLLNKRPCFGWIGLSMDHRMSNLC